MKITEQTFSVRTSRRNEMIDITSQVQIIVSDSGIDSGIAIVTCPHTTAGITVNENADPDVPHDILLTLDALIPELRKGYRHNEGNSDSHVKSSLVGCSEILCFFDKKLRLGTWQGVFFCEFDGPRSRRTNVRVLG
jgi:secondary thiamine-phosphate synthase enzyme